MLVEKDDDDFLEPHRVQQLLRRNPACPAGRKNDEECDARNDDSSTEAGFIIII